MKKIAVIDLFSGAGGFSLGFGSAGFNIVGAIENVKVFSQTHKTNFPDSTTISADIRDVSPKELASQIKQVKYDSLVVIGGPPCQSFSVIGTPKIRSLNKDEKSDPRNYLYKEFFAYIKYFKPDLFLMENVPALQTKYDGILFKRILSEVVSLGYSPSFSVLNSVEFGVPQVRKRLFIVGTKKCIDFKFPIPTHSQDSCLQVRVVNVEGAKPATTVFDAIADLPHIYDGCRLGALPYSRDKGLSEYQVSIRNSDGFVGNNVCRMSNVRAKQVFAHMKQGDKYMDLAPEIRRILPFREDIFHDRLKRLAFDKPSWTILAHIGMDGYMYIHPTENRTLSVREAARIQSFHDSFCFVGNMREQYIQVGNAVPPLMASALAKQVKIALL